MLFLRTRQLVALIILITGLFFLGAVIGYLALMENGDKFHAERLFLYGIVVLSLIVLFSIRILIFGRQALRKFDKILNLVKQQGVLPLDRLAYFGGFGVKMQNLYSELHALGERKSSRIQQQNVTISKLMEFIEAPLLIVDVTGEIRKASGGFAGKNKISAAGVSGKDVHEFIEGLDFHAILLEANRTKGIVEIEKDKNKVTFYPVLSIKNDVAYFITVFGKHEIFSFSGTVEEKQKTSSRREKKRPFSGLLDLFRRKE